MKVFPPALLGRLITIPYYPLSDAVMGDIIRLQLGRIAKRISEHHKVPFTYDDDVVELIKARCTEPESGGRNDRCHSDEYHAAGYQRGVFRTADGGGGWFCRLRWGLRAGEFSYAF